MSDILPLGYELEQRLKDLEELVNTKDKHITELYQRSVVIIDRNEKLENRIAELEKKLDDE